MNFFIFFFIFFLVLLAGYGYVGVRLIMPMQLPAPWNSIAWALLVALYLVPAATMFLTFNRIEADWTGLLSWVAYVGLGFFSFLFTFTLLKDMGLFGIMAFEKVRDLFAGTGTAQEAIDPERRRVLIRGVHLSIVGVASGLTGYGIFEARRRPGIVEVAMPIARLPEAFDGFRIIQLTDIHAGLTVARPFVETVVEMANELRGDLIAFTGDLVDGSVARLRKEVQPVQDLTAPFGKFFITGNHEYYSGAEAWVEEAHRLGFDTLMNEHRVIEKDGFKIVLAGVTDIGAGGFVKSHSSDPVKSVQGSPDGLVKILLAHQPRSLDKAVEAGVDAMISGHTHGGQFFPWNLAAALGQPYLKGLHKHGNMWVYVSKGTGYWGPPIRLGSRSEITVITLRQAGGRTIPGVK